MPCAFRERQISKDTNGSYEQIDGEKCQGVGWALVYTSSAHSRAKHWTFIFVRHGPSTGTTFPVGGGAPGLSTARGPPTMRAGGSSTAAGASRIPVAIGAMFPPSGMGNPLSFVGAALPGPGEGGRCIRAPGGLKGRADGGENGLPTVGRPDRVERVGERCDPANANDDGLPDVCCTRPLL